MESAGGSGIGNREEFMATLERARSALSARAEADPQYGLWRVMLRQLEAMFEWSAGGQTPSQAERDQMTVGTLAVPELEPIDAIDCYRLGQDLHELQYYFQHLLGKDGCRGPQRA